MVEKWDPVLGPWYTQYLRIPWTPGTPRTSGLSNRLGPQDLRTLGKLPLPFEIPNLNTVQLFLICCKKYRNEVSHKYSSVVFSAKVLSSYFVKHLKVAPSKFGLLIPKTKIFSLVLSFLVTYFKNIYLIVNQFDLRNQRNQL